MARPCEPADEDGEVHLPHRLLLHVLLVEGAVVEDQPARDGDHGEGVDGGGDAEPQARDHQLAAELADHLLNALHLGQDTDEKKNSCEAVIDSEGKYHPVSSLAPETSVFVKKKAEERVEENDKERADHNESRPYWTFKEAFPKMVCFCLFCSPIEPGGKVVFETYAPVLGFN